MLESAIDLSVVIPVYGSRDTLRQLVDRLVPVLHKTGKSFEIVFVDDSSPDDAWSVLQELAARFPGRITIVQLMRNFGQHNALMCGLRQARGQVIVTMDDDLQNPPEEIPTLLAALESRNLDLVYGSYADTKKHSAFRNFGSNLVQRFFRFVFKLPVTVGPFRALRRELAESIFSYDLNFTYLDGLFAWNTQRVGEVPVAHHPRAAGRSGYSLRRLVLLALNLFTNFSLLPLQMASCCGLAAASLGFLAAFVCLFRYLISSITVPGYASTVIAVLILGGLQLLALGIMGEYLGRLHLNVNRKPQYVVRHCRPAEAEAAPLSKSA